MNFSSNVIESLGAGTTVTTNGTPQTAWTSQMLMEPEDKVCIDQQDAERTRIGFVWMMDRQQQVQQGRVPIDWLKIQRGWNLKGTIYL